MDHLWPPAGWAQPLGRKFLFPRVLWLYRPQRAGEQQSGKGSPQSSPLGTTGEDTVDEGVKLPENIGWSSNIACAGPSFAPRGEKRGVPSLNSGVGVRLGHVLNRALVSSAE